MCAVYLCEDLSSSPSAQMKNYGTGDAQYWEGRELLQVV